MNGFLKIGITSPGPIENEALRIAAFLRSGEVDYMHIRKPEWDISEVRRLISGIDPELHPRLRIHGHFSLLGEFRLAGVHINYRNPFPPQGCTSVTKSCHTIEEIGKAGCYEYVTLSPVFDSISKAGYHSAFDLNDLRDKIAGQRVVALGGVTPDKFPELMEAGFYGAAMLGSLWI